MDSNSAIAVLTAMITPAVLISACGSMILSTSSRLGRVVDRVRGLSDKWESMTDDEKQTADAMERQAVTFEQLDKLTSRARILQRSMVVFYLAVGMFVATSVAIGVVAFTNNPRYNVVPVALGLVGACFLFYGSILLIFEARLALSTIHSEMDFVWRLSKKFAPAGIVEQHKPHFVHFRRHEYSQATVAGYQAQRVFLSDSLPHWCAGTQGSFVRGLTRTLHGVPARLPEQSSGE